MSEHQGEKARLITHGLADAIGGLLASQLERVERDHDSAVAAARAEALREAARLPAEALDAAWDSNGFAIGVRPPWSYLRRFLNALADTTESSSTPVQREQS